MKRRTTILSLGYWFSSTNLGMMLHPYKTVRELVRLPGFSPLVLSPVVWIGTFWVIAMGGILVGRIISQEAEVNYSRWFLDIWEFIFWWVMWFLGWWQVLVLYLYARFKAVLK